VVLKVQSQVDRSIILPKVTVLLTIAYYEAYSDIGELQYAISLWYWRETELMETSQ
jgi:hypothetical protein